MMFHSVFLTVIYVLFPPHFIRLTVTAHLRITWAGEETQAAPHRT